MSSQSKRSNLEISVSEAGTLLGMSDRSILNYIKAKEIDAIKVGKKWFINLVSLEAFKRKYGFPEPEVWIQNEVTPTEQAPQLFPNSQENAGSRSAFSKLRCYALCKMAFEMPNWVSLCEVKDKALVDRLLALKYDAQQFLGAGYFSYQIASKIAHYEASRGAIGGILAILHAQREPLVQCWKSEVDYIEQKLLPAYSALIRKIEKRS